MHLLFRELILRWMLFILLRSESDHGRLYKDTETPYLFPTRHRCSTFISTISLSVYKMLASNWFLCYTLFMEQPRSKNGRFSAKQNPAVSHLIIPDTQCQPGVDLSHLYWAGRYAADKKPDVIIHLGDNWDMSSLSSYESKGSKYFEGRRYNDDIAAGNQGLLLFEKGLDGFKPKRKILLRGNHEYRIIKAINADPKLEGLIGYHNFNDVELGWEVVDFLVPIEVDGITYSHYFQSPGNGRPYSGQIDTILKNVGFSFVAGHQQGLKISRRELTNGKVHTGIIAGSFYLHNENYRGPQATNEWRGILVLHEVRDGNYDLMTVSLDFLRRKYGS